MIVLYQFPGGDGVSSVSPPCVRVEMALRLLGVEYRRVDLRTRRAARRVSVTTRLPVLEIDGERITDSIAILDTLERRWPHAPWIPGDPAERVRDRAWEHFANDHVYFMAHYLRWLSPEYRERWIDVLFGRAPVWVRVAGRFVLVRDAERRAAAFGTAGRDPDEIKDLVLRAVDMLDVAIGTGPFLEGRATPGRGDLAAAATLVQVGFRGTLPDLMEHVFDRPRLIALTRGVLAACRMESPRWLGPAPDATRSGAA